MRFHHLVVCMATALLVAACGTQPQIQERVVFKTRYVTIPDALLQSYDTPKPPEREAYLSLSMKDKEMSLANYAVELTKTIGLYKNRLKEIDTMQKSQVEIYKGNEDVR